MLLIIDMACTCGLSHHGFKNNGAVGAANHNLALQSLLIHFYVFYVSDTVKARAAFNRM